LEQQIKQLCLENKIKFKNDFCIKLFESVEFLEQNKVYHRDIHYENILLNYTDCLNVLIIDFNVSKKYNSVEHVKRGSIRYYPICAIDSMYKYSYDCDKYMASFIVYEILEEHEIYPECKGNTKEILKLRKNLMLPEWSKNTLETFSNIVNKINEIWH
jgi:serine/threonine protein kinase